MIGLMTRHTRLETFLFEHDQRFMNSVNSVNRRRVMIRALRALAPIAHDEIHIQEPALDFLSTRTNYFHSRVTKGDGRDTRQSGEALLSPRVDNVRTPRVSF